MRSLEIVLVLCGALQLLTLMFRTRKPFGADGLTSAIGAGSLVAHLIIEGYRWQMAATYVLTIAGILIFILRRSQGEITGRKLWKPLRCMGYGAGCILLVGSSLLASAMPVLRLPEPEGAYAVGTETLHLIDGEREEIFTEEPDDQRELMVQIWYPAQQKNHPAGKQASLFPEDRQIFEAFAKAYAAELNLPVFVLNYWKHFRTNAFEQTPIASSGQPFPIVLISHGEGTSRLLHVSQAENLASHGYIVAAIDHTYSTQATAFPDGRVSGYTIRSSGTVVEQFEHASRVGAVWTQDITYVIRSLEQLNEGAFGGVFQGRIDLDRIGMMGHSFGGATAFRAVNDIPAIRAGINMDGTLYDIRERDGMDKPLLFMESEQFLTWKTKLERGEVDDPAIHKRLSAELAVIDRAVDQGGTLIFVEGASHYNFTDLQLFTEMLDLTGMTGSIKGERGARLVNAYVLEFFDKHLKGTGSGKLLRGPSPLYPEVKFP